MNERPFHERRIAAPVAVDFARPFRISSQIYLEMIEAGILSEEDRCELIGGMLVRREMMNAPHCYFVAALAKWFILNLQVHPRWDVRPQSSAVMEEGNVPEPDLAIIRGQNSDFQNRLPQPPDIALVIEVADTSLARDRKTKLRLYARCGIPAYWIVNIPDRQIETHAQPTASGSQSKFGRRKVYKPGTSIPVVIDGTAIARLDVSDLFG